MNDLRPSDRAVWYAFAMIGSTVAAASPIRISEAVESSRKNVAEGCGSADVACTIGSARQVTSNLFGPGRRMSMLGPERRPTLPPIAVAICRVRSSQASAWAARGARARQAASRIGRRGIGFRPSGPLPFWRGTAPLSRPPGKGPDP